MKIRSFIVITALALALSACSIDVPLHIKFDPSTIGLEEGSGNVISKDVRVSGFDKVTLNGTGQVDVTFGSRESLTIEAEDNVIDKISATVEDGTLTLSYLDPFRVVPTKPIKFHLTATELEGFTLNGVGDVSIKGIEGEELAVTINGAGTLAISGSLETQEVTINGTGSYQAGDLESEAARVTINGVGDGVVWASETLEVRIGGAGNLQYYGSPMVTQSINGAGSVESKGKHR